MTGREPLSIVVSRSIGSITRAYDDAAPDGTPSLAMQGALLRLAPLAPFPQHDLPSLSRLSSRAGKVAVTAATRRGWVVVDADPERPRRTTVRFTSRGEEAAATAATLLASVEDRWLGERSDAAELRGPAEALVAAFDLELPHHPISYGTADVTITGGAYARGSDPDPRVPPHGADWKPVLRADPTSAVGLAISALLSEVLVQFTIDYERRGGVNLHAAVHVLRHIGDGGIPLETSADLGITGGGKSYLERHGVVQVGRSPTGAGRIVRLTLIGARLRDAYEPLMTQIESDWRARYGDARIAAIATGLQGRSDTWLPLDDRGATPDDHVVVGLTSSG